MRITLEALILCSCRGSVARSVCREKRILLEYLTQKVWFLEWASLHYTHCRAVVASLVSPVSTEQPFPYPWLAWHRQLEPELSKCSHKAPRTQRGDMLKWLQTVQNSGGSRISLRGVCKVGRACAPAEIFENHAHFRSKQRPLRS